MTLHERALAIITEALNHGTITFPEENVTLTLKAETIINLAKTLSVKEETKPKLPSLNLPSDMSFTFMETPFSSEVIDSINNPADPLGLYSNYSDDSIDGNQLILPFKHEGK
jgi:hypothetical protein